MYTPSTRTIAQARLCRTRTSGAGANTKRVRPLTVTAYVFSLFSFFFLDLWTGAKHQDFDNHVECPTNGQNHQVTAYTGAT